MTGRARPLSDIPPPAGPAARLADQWLDGKCIESCGRTAVMNALRCSLCEQRRLYLETGDPMVFGERATCQDDQYGALCAPGKHAKACIRRAQAGPMDRWQTTMDEEALGVGRDG